MNAHDRRDEAPGIQVARDALRRITNSPPNTLEAVDALPREFLAEVCLAADALDGRFPEGRGTEARLAEILANIDVDRGIEPTRDVAPEEPAADE